MEMQEQNRKNDQAHTTEMLLAHLKRLYDAEDKTVDAFEKLAEEGKRGWGGHLISGLYRDFVRELKFLQRDRNHLQGLFAGIIAIYGDKIVAMLEAKQTLELDDITGFKN